MCIHMCVREKEFSEKVRRIEREGERVYTHANIAGWCSSEGGGSGGDGCLFPPKFTLSSSQPFTKIKI